MNKRVLITDLRFIVGFLFSSTCSRARFCLIPPSCSADISLPCTEWFLVVMLSCRRSCCVLRLRCYGIVSALLPSLRMNGRVYVSAIVTHRLLTTLLANPPRITTTAPTPTRNVTFTVHFLSRIFFFFAFTVFFFNKTLLRGCIVSRRQEISSFVIQSLFAYPAVRYDIYWCVRASLDPDAKQKKKSWCCYSPASGSNESHYMTFSRRKSAQEYRIWKTDRISNGNERRLDGLHARIELSWFIHPHRWSIKRW